MPLASLNVGLIGARSSEIDAIVPALLAQQRFTIASIYDSCYQAARDLAAPLKAKPAPSLVQMLEKNELKGVIVLDTNWQRTQPIFMTCCHQMPTLFAPQAGLDDPFIAEHLFKLSSERRTLLMPAYSHRWSPAVLRVQELSATCLGPVESINFQLSSLETTQLAQSFDWCWNLIQSSPTQVRAHGSESIEVQFRRKQTGGNSVTATLSFGTASEARASIVCRKGTLTFLNDQQLVWSNGVEEQQEVLASDRSAIAVMLDLFGRRLAGGLVPVPTLEDVIRNQNVLAMILESRSCDRAVMMPEG